MFRPLSRCRTGMFIVAGTLIAAGLSAQQAAKTDEDEARLQQEIDMLRNLLLDAASRSDATLH